MTAVVTLAPAAPAQASSGIWDRAWGNDVVAGRFEICTVAADCLGGASGGLGGEINSPNGVGTDAAGNVYVADTSNNRIQKFDLEGNFLRAWGKDVDTAAGTGFEICTVAANCKAGSSGGLGGEMSFAAGVGTDTVGNVYLADIGNDRIQKFDSEGNFLRAWGKDVDSVTVGHPGCQEVRDLRSWLGRNDR